MKLSLTKKEVQRLFGRPGRNFCWTQLIRYLLANPEHVILNPPMKLESQPRPSEMLRTLRTAYQGPSYHSQSLPALPRGITR